MQVEGRKALSRTGFAFVWGGAVGNIIDRASYGHVIDFIMLHTANWSFAIFNIADSFISVGAGLVIIDEILAWMRERKASAPSN